MNGHFDYLLGSWLSNVRRGRIGPAGNTMKDL